MTDKRILTIQDISCVGQCSLTVALPILSACGIETAILPSAVLSTHTAQGFSGYTCRDLTDDIPAVAAHWQRQQIKFDALYTGYLGSAKQIDYVKDIKAKLINGLTIVDPAMADNGTLYPAFDAAFVEAMKKLVYAADIILPNITEACFLTGIDYREEYDEAYILKILKELAAHNVKTVILTGVSYTPATTGVAVYQDNKLSYYEHRKIERSCHGTGDVYASAFVGAVLNNFSAFEAAKIAADYTVNCILNTLDDKEHWYGVKFEGVLPQLMARLNLK